MTITRMLEQQKRDLEAWEAERKRYRRRDFLTTLVAGCVGGAAVGWAVGMIVRRLDRIIEALQQNEETDREQD